MLFFAVIMLANVFASDEDFLGHKEIIRRFETKIFTTNSRPLRHRMMRMEVRPHADRIQVYSIPSTVKTKVDLRFRDTATKRQFGSTCSAFGLAASMENALFSIKPIDLSERHLWNKYRKYSSKSAIKAALNKGAITHEDLWAMGDIFPKFGYKKYAKAILKSAPYIDTKVDLAIKALDQNKPVYLGLSVTDSLYACHKVVDPKSPPNGGGHAVSVVGYGLNQSIPSGGYFIIKNSWSADCGDHGYQYVPFNYCSREDMYCIMWVIDEVGLIGRYSQYDLSYE